MKKADESLAFVPVGANDSEQHVEHSRNTGIEQRPTTTKKALHIQVQQTVHRPLPLWYCVVHPRAIPVSFFLCYNVWSNTRMRAGQQ